MIGASSDSNDESFKIFGTNRNDGVIAGRSGTDPAKRLGPGQTEGPVQLRGLIYSVHLLEIFKIKKLKNSRNRVESKVQMSGRKRFYSVSNRSIGF